VVEQEQAMMEEVQEARERLVAGVADPIGGVFGDVDGERAVRPEETEEVDPQPGRAAAARLDAGERRGREGQGGLLPEAGRVGRPAAPPPRAEVTRARGTRAGA